MIIHCLSPTYSCHGVLTSRLQICASIGCSADAVIRPSTTSEAHRTQDHPTLIDGAPFPARPTHRLPANSIQSPYIHRTSGLAQIAVSTPLRIKLPPTRNLCVRSAVDTALEICQQLKITTTSQKMPLRFTRAEAQSSGQRELHVLRESRWRAERRRSAGGASRRKRIGSSVFTPKRKLARKRVSQKAPPVPSTTPTNVSDHSLPDNHVAQIRSLCPKRHADAEFLRTLLDGIGHDPIDSDGGHEQSCGSKDSEKQHIEALTRCIARLDLVHGANMRNRQTAAGIVKSSSDWQQQLCADRPGFG